MNYVEVAPLPCAMADHLFRSFRKRNNVYNAEALFVALVREKRRALFTVLDAYARTGKITRKFVLDELRVYNHMVSESEEGEPGEDEEIVGPRSSGPLGDSREHYTHDMSEGAFTDWVNRGLIEMDSYAKPKPLSAQSIILASMIDPRQRGFLPKVVTPGDTWQCYIQRHPDAEVEAWPVGQINELPASALCWTPMRAAYWEPEWRLIGDTDHFLGCMRFAGVTKDRGQIVYDVSIEDIQRWDAHVAALYLPLPDNTLAPIQHLCLVLFDRLVHSRLGEEGAYHG